MGLADQILARTGLPEAVVSVPEWDCEVIVRAMSGAVRSGMEKRAIAAGGGDGLDPTEVTVSVLSTCVLDPATREPVFTRAQAKELILSPVHSGIAVTRVVNMVLLGAALGKGAQDDVTRNFSSDGTPTSSSTSSATRSASRSSRK